MDKSWMEKRLKYQDEALDFFGEKVIAEVWDVVLRHSFQDITGKSPNTQQTEKYKALQTLNPEQKEVIKELLLETVTDTVFELLNMFGRADQLKLTIFKEGQEFDYNELSEHTGSEILPDPDGTDWITKFSKLNRLFIG